MKGLQLKRLHHRTIMRQMVAANRLSYAVIDDMLFQGVVRLCCVLSLRCACKGGLMVCA